MVANDAACDCPDGLAHDPVAAITRHRLRLLVVTGGRSRVARWRFVVNRGIAIDDPIAVNHWRWGLIDHLRFDIHFLDDNALRSMMMVMLPALFVVPAVVSEGLGTEDSRDDEC